jgi:zinc protease
MSRQFKSQLAPTARSCWLALALACAGAGSKGSESPNAAGGANAASESGDQSWRQTTPAAAAPHAVEYPAAQMAILPNGVQLWLVPRKSGTVALSLNALAGGSACSPGHSGLAALTLRLMTEATQQKTGLALAEAAEALGASIDFDTGRDGSSVSVEVLPSDAEAALGLLAEVITQPRFAAGDVERIRRQWLDSLRSERQEPSRLASLAGMRALLGPVIAAPVRGSVPDVEKLTRKDVLKFHEQWYVAGNLAVLAVGDLTLERLTELAQKGLGKLPARKAPALPAIELPPPPARTTVWLVDRPDAVQSALFVGQAFPDRGTPGYESRQVMNNLLGGLFTSRLNLNLREKHAYTYGVRSSAIATRRFGAFVGQSSIKTESTADALEQLTLELRTLAAGKPEAITPEELDRSKTDLIHQLGANLEQVRHILADTTELYVDALPSDYQSRFASRILEVDQRMAAAEGARLTPDHLSVVIVGDKQKLTPLLAAKGISAQDAPPAFTE